MSLLGRRGPYDIDNHALDRRSSLHNTRKGVTKEGKKMMLLLLANTALALFVYFGCLSLNFAPILFVYIGLAAVLMIGYVIYNRGFALRGVTPEMLPDELSAEQKQAMLDEAQRRMQASRFMLTLIVPLVVAVLLDVIYLFWLQDLLISLGIGVG